MSGVTLEYTEAQLQACAEAYDPALHRAPMVVGHPKMDDPSYGWVESLDYSDGILRVTDSDQVEVEFQEMVNDGRFSKVSPSFYLPDAPNNPKPGTLYIKHLGFLGAAAPAIKGLKTASFAEKEEGVVEFADWDQMTIAGLFRKVRELFITKHGLEAADQALPTYEIDSLQNSAVEDKADDALPVFSESTDEPNTGDDMSKELQDQIDKLTADNKALAATNKTQGEQITSFAEQQLKSKTAATHADNVSFAEGLVSAGQLAPTDKDDTVIILDQLATLETEVEFGEGDDKQKTTPLAMRKKQLSAAPKLVNFGEQAPAGEGGDGTVNFAAPAGYDVDQSALDLHAKTLAYAEKNDVTYDEALTKTSAA